MCAGRHVLCQHKEPLSSCANCRDWGHCTCRLQADDLQEVHDNLLPLAQADHPRTYASNACLFHLLTYYSAVEMHDCNFLAADRQICHLLNALHEAYQLRTAALCNLLQAFSQVEGAHDTDAFEKFARDYSTGRCLLIDMGLVRDEDGVLQRVAAPQLRHYYPRPLTVHSETTPEPQLPAFTVLPHDVRPVGGSESDEDSDGDRQDKETMAQDLEQDQLSPSSPVRPEPMMGPSVRSLFLFSFHFYLLGQSRSS